MAEGRQSGKCIAVSPKLRREMAPMQGDLSVLGQGKTQPRLADKLKYETPQPSLGRALTSVNNQRDTEHVGDPTERRVQ